MLFYRWHGMLPDLAPLQVIEMEFLKWNLPCEIEPFVLKSELVHMCVNMAKLKAHILQFVWEVFRIVIIMIMAANKYKTRWSPVFCNWQVIQIPTEHTFLLGALKQEVTSPRVMHISPLSGCFWLWFNDSMVWLSLSHEKLELMLSRCTSLSWAPMQNKIMLVFPHLWAYVVGKLCLKNIILIISYHDWFMTIKSCKACYMCCFVNFDFIQNVMFVYISWYS